MPTLPIEQISKELELTKQELTEMVRKHRLVASELSNMVRAQGNLYRFQEKIEQQKIIYAQVAQVGHRFNETLDFQEIIDGIDRFIIDLLNFERFLLLLPSQDKETLVVKHHGGYRGEDLKALEALKFSAKSSALQVFFEGDERIFFTDTDPSAEAKELRDKFLMQELFVFSLGKNSDGLKGVLIVGNSEQNKNLHQRVGPEPETEALFANFTSQIAGALNTLKFMQGIQSESNQVKRLLNNMRQAVFSVDAQGKIVDPVSKFSDSIFATSIAGQSVWETIFKDLPDDSETKSALVTAFATVFGEGELQWELMEDQFPTRLNYKKPNESEESILKVAFRPIWDEQDCLEKIMFVVEDITELEKLERQILKDREEIQIIQELAKNTAENLTNFFLRSSELLEQCREMVSKLDHDPTQLGPMMRNLHTLKGNARLFNISLVSKRVHTAESSVLDLKNKLIDKKLDPLDSKIQISKELVEVQEQIQEYAQIAQRILNIANVFEAPLLAELDRLLIAIDEAQQASDRGLLWDLVGVAKALRSEELMPSINLVTESLQRQTLDPNGVAKLQNSLMHFYSKTSAFRPYNSQESMLTQFFLLVFQLSLALKQSDKKSLLSTLNEFTAKASEGAYRYFQQLAIKLENALDEQGRFREYLIELWNYLFLAAHLRKNQTLSPKERSLLKTRFKNQQQVSESDSVRLAWQQFLTACQQTAKLSPAQVMAEIQPFLKTDLLELLFAPNEEKLPATLLQELSFNYADNAASQKLMDEFRQTAPAFHSLLSRFWRQELPKFNLALDLLQLCYPYLYRSSGSSIVSEIKTMEIVDISFQRLERAIEKLGRSPDRASIEEIQRDFRRLRDLPVKPMLVKFESMVREVSASLGKQVEFRVSGDEATLPKDKLNALQDALVHMVRNGIDHGLESAEERKKLHKNETGLLEIQCFEQKDKVVIVVSDDGKGIDPDRIAKVALQKGIISKEQFAKMGAQEKQDLIFRPGFSTKEQATELSGRGVGMDIVASMVRKMNASIHLVSRIGIGSEFTIEISTAL